MELGEESFLMLTDRLCRDTGVPMSSKTLSESHQIAIIFAYTVISSEEIVDSGTN
jgi:hypothetical protein